MKIGVIQCDYVLDRLVSVHGTYPQMYAALFDQAQIDVELLTYDAIKGEYPEDIDECDGYITTGSRYGANDDLPWLAELEKFILKLHKSKKKFVGICFGHQLIAKVLGGIVVLSTKGWGVGLSFNEIIQKKEWMKPFSCAMDLVVSHQDQVVKLPKSAEVIVKSDFCSNYMIQYGEHFLGIQGHPEFSKEYSEALMDDRREKIPARRIGEGIILLQTNIDAELAAVWIYNFFNRRSQ